MKKRDKKHICPNCGFHRWKTISKGKTYRCRDCGYRKEKK